MSDALKDQIPYPALADLVRWLESADVPFTIIGGLSVSIVSQPRPTIDVNLVVWLDPEHWQQFLELAGKFGITPRRDDALEFAKQRRVMLLQHKATGIGIDVSFGALPFEEEMIRRARSIELSGVRLRVATPEDIIIMKMIAHRDKDIRDIDNIMSVHQDLDFDRIKEWVRQFSEVLETPELNDELVKLIKSHHPH
jgi:predicted nucleotidyltransferase